MRFFTSVYLLLLAYIIAALVWWEISLQQQSEHIYAQEVLLLRSQVDSSRNPDLYNIRLHDLQYGQHGLSVRTKEYTGEGTTFLLVILIGAAVVYSSFHRSLRLSRQQNNFMLSVTHELKSPIAAMKLNLQTLEKHLLNETMRKQIVERCIVESDRLNELCNNLLFATQIEGRSYKQAKEKFNFSDMVEDCIKEYGERYPKRFIEDIVAGCMITGDKIMLQMAVNNLLENAIKYVKDSSRITIKLEIALSNAVLQIIDEGPGIPDNEKGKIFNKFYRIGNEESRKSKGAGLGLYLVKKIVQQHRGRVGVKNNLPHGSVFEIDLPIR